MGKLGIIFAFLLSVAAAGGSYYLYQGWVEARIVQSSVQAKYDQAKEKIITVQAEKEQITAKSEQYRTKAETMQSQVEKLQTEQSRIDSEKAALEKKLESDQKMIAELQAKMGELEEKAKNAQAACGVVPADLKTDPFSAAQSFSSTPASAMATAGVGTSQLVFKPVIPGRSVASASSPAAMPSSAASKGADTVKVAVNAGGVSVITATSPAGTSTAVTTGSSQSAEVFAKSGTTTGAKVLTVNRKFNFVVINQGLQEGLKMGDRLKVLKQGRESATVQIEKLYDKFSAATLVEEDPKQQVVEGDEIRKV
jgi:hypothetical protein